MDRGVDVLVVIINSLISGTWSLIKLQIRVHMRVRSQDFMSRWLEENKASNRKKIDLGRKVGFIHQWNNHMVIVRR